MLSQQTQRGSSACASAIKSEGLDSQSLILELKKLLSAEQRQSAAVSKEWSGRFASAKAQALALHAEVAGFVDSYLKRCVQTDSDRVDGLQSRGYAATLDYDAAAIGRFAEKAVAALFDAERSAQSRAGTIGGLFRQARVLDERIIAEEDAPRRALNEKVLRELVRCAQDTAKEQKLPILRKLIRQGERAQIEATKKLGEKTVPDQHQQQISTGSKLIPEAVTFPQIGTTAHFEQRLTDLQSRLNSLLENPERTTEEVDALEAELISLHEEVAQSDVAGSTTAAGEVLSEVVEREVGRACDSILAIETTEPVTVDSAGTPNEEVAGVEAVAVLTEKRALKLMGQIEKALGREHLDPESVETLNGRVEKLSANLTVLTNEEDSRRASDLIAQAMERLHSSTDPHTTSKTSGSQVIDDETARLLLQAVTASSAPIETEATSADTAQETSSLNASEVITSEVPALNQVDTLILVLTAKPTRETFDLAVQGLQAIEQEGSIAVNELGTQKQKLNSLAKGMGIQLPYADVSSNAELDKHLEAKVERLENAREQLLTLRNSLLEEANDASRYENVTQARIQCDQTNNQLYRIKESFKEALRFVGDIYSREERANQEAIGQKAFYEASDLVEFLQTRAERIHSFSTFQSRATAIASSGERTQIQLQRDKVVRENAEASLHDSKNSLEKVRLLLSQDAAAKTEDAIRETERELLPENKLVAGEAVKQASDNPVVAPTNSKEASPQRGKLVKLDGVSATSEPLVAGEIISTVNTETVSTDNFGGLIFPGSNVFREPTIIGQGPFSEETQLSSSASVSSAKSPEESHQVEPKAQQTTIQESPKALATLSGLLREPAFNAEFLSELNRLEVSADERSAAMKAFEKVFSLYRQAEKDILFLSKTDKKLSALDSSTASLQKLESGIDEAMQEVAESRVQVQTALMKHLGRMFGYAESRFGNALAKEGKGVLEAYAALREIRLGLQAIFPDKKEELVIADEVKIANRMVTGKQTVQAEILVQTVNEVAADLMANLLSTSQRSKEGQDSLVFGSQISKSDFEILEKQVLFAAHHKQQSEDSMKLSAANFEHEQERIKTAFASLMEVFTSRDDDEQAEQAVA